jgi:anti-anti-sigma factor
MSFTVTQHNNYSIITSQVDKLNATNAPDLKAAILKQNRGNVNNIIIDLSHTSYCDSSGLSAILSANRICKESSGKFVLCGLQPNVRKMIEIAQLHRILTITEDVNAAIELI